MFKSFATAWNKYWFEPTSPVPICAFRIVFGVIAMCTLALLAPDVRTWFGSDGIISIATAKVWEGDPRFSLLFLVPQNDQFMVALFCLMFLAAFTLTIGFATRTSAAILFVCFISFIHRNPVILHSGDTFIRLSSLLLAMSPAGMCYSVDTWLKKRRGQPLAEPALAAPWVQHLLQFQIAAVYFGAFIGKIDGQSWIDGTAVYYSSRLLDFQRFYLPFVFDNLWTIKALTWGALVIELSLWTLIWYRPLRYYVLVAGVLLHLGIELTMNLPFFECVMIASYLVFIDPQDIQKFALSLKLPNLPKRPSIPPRLAGALAIAALIAIGANGAVQFAEFPLNGNPVLWLKAKDFYNQGAQARKRFDLETAERKFKEAVNTYPNDGKFLNSLGECYLREKKYTEAEAVLDKAVSANPKDVSSWRLLSMAYAMQDKTDKAIEAVRKALDVAPSDSAATGQLGLLLASQGNMSEAASVFDQSRKLDRSSAEYWSFAGRYYKLLGKPQETEAAFRQAESQDPTEPEYNEWLGLCLASLGKKSEAEHFMRKATNLDPNNVEYWIALADLQADQEQAESALDSLRHAIKLRPDDAILKKNYGLLLYSQRLFPEAEECFRSLLSKTPFDARVFSYYIDSLLFQQKFAVVRDVLKQRIESDKSRSQPVNWIYMGDSLALEGKTEEAIGAYKMALTYDVNPEVKANIEERIKSPPAKAAPIHLEEEKQSQD